MEQIFVEDKNNQQANSIQSSGLNSARLVSTVLNPISLVVISIVLLIFHGPMEQRFRWGLIFFTFSLFIPLLLLFWQLGNHQITDLFIKIRQQRYGIYAAAFLSNVILNWLVIKLDAALLLQMAVQIGLIQIVGMGFINFFYKISAHASCMFLFSILLIMLYGPIGSFSFLLTPLVCWSRVALKRHTLPQTIAGVAMAGFSFMMIFMLQEFA